MKLVEYKVKHGEIAINSNEKVLSFAVEDDGTIIFFAAVSDKETNEPANKYYVLDTGDDVPENYRHVATLVEGTMAKHIFLEYIDPADLPKKKVTKLITSEGTEEFVEDVDPENE